MQGLTEHAQLMTNRFEKIVVDLEAGVTVRETLTKHHSAHLSGALRDFEAQLYDGRLVAIRAC